jgi:murein DD-endopeptidase MepM/ murein hydrolase activator NlpD
VARCVQVAKDLTYVAIRHTKPLILKNGTRIPQWWTMYGHLKIAAGIVDGVAVAKGTILGTISNVGADNNHLHFVIYRDWVDGKSDAISPYWLPGFYSASKALYADDQYGTRYDGGEPGLYDNRIFSPPPSK